MIFISLFFTGVQDHSLTMCSEVTPVSLVACGMWPLSPSKWTFITFETMQLLSSLTNFSPSTSLRSIVQAMNFNTHSNKLASNIFKPKLLPNDILHKLHQCSCMLFLDSSVEARVVQRCHQRMEEAGV